MGDMGEIFRDMKEHGKKVRKKVTKENQRFREEMTALGATETELTTNSYRYSFKDFSIDYYPPSGKWTIVGTNKFTTGPRKMVDEVKGILADYEDLKKDPELTPQEWARGSNPPPPAIQRIISVEEDPTPPWKED